MTLTLDTLDGTLWLCEPTQLRLAAVRVFSQRGCPTARALVEERRQRLEIARQPMVLLGQADGFHLGEQAQTKPVRGVKGGVGIVPIYGLIEQRLTPELLKAGGTSVEEIDAGFSALLGNKAVDAIVLDVASPGGDVSGVPELASKIMAARQQKKVYAVANSLSASAALWLATAAQQFFVTPSGYVGSVGVYMMHVDQSKALETEGVKVSLVSAGKYKTEGNPFEPLADGTREHLQSLVDQTYGKFVSALSAHRDVGVEHVRTRFGQGRMMGAEDAVSVGLADRVMSLDDLLGRLVGGSKASSLKLQHDLAKARGE